MAEVRVRLGMPSDAEQVSRLCELLWADASWEEHQREILPVLAGMAATTMPIVIFVADAGDDGLSGFIEVGLRSHADGCDTRLPVGYVEGWLVKERWRKQGVGARLLVAAEDWARAQGCVEIASDTWIDSSLSQSVHEALNFQVVDRCVHYRKPL